MDINNLQRTPSHSYRVDADRMLIGVGGASNFSLRLGEGNKEDASKFVGNT